VCLWEHAPLEIADQVLTPLPESPDESVPGAHHALCRMLRHGRLLHWSRDSGQTRLMSALGYAAPETTIQTSPVLALPVAAPAVAPATGDSSVAFIGHVYQGLAPYAEERLDILAAGSISEWMHDRQVPLWDVLGRKIAALPPALRQRLALDRDQTFFWRFAHRVIVSQAQTALRLHMLGAAGVPVVCYGNLDASHPGIPANLRPVPGRVAYGAELAGVLARHAIVIDVHNPGVIDGFSEKAILAFTAGGFALVDRKQDWVDTFGALGEAVSYIDADDLASKVDLFLSRPRFRRELADAMRHEIQTRHRLDHLLADVLTAAAERSRGASGPLAPHPEGGPPPIVVMRLVREVRSYPYWNGRVEQVGDGALVTTSAVAWEYAAEIPLPATLDAMRGPHLRLRVRVQTGCLGFAVNHLASGKLAGEQLASAAPDVLALSVELPPNGPISVIVRNATEGQSCGLLTDVELCERAA
jgi:hypothetical protein